VERIGVRERQITLLVKAGSGGIALRKPPPIIALQGEACRFQDEDTALKPLNRTAIDCYGVYLINYYSVIES
jgi:hypothetical protein